MIEGYKQIDEIVKKGEVTWTWCSKHMDRTAHMYTGSTLYCMECYPNGKQDQEKGKRK